MVDCSGFVLCALPLLALYLYAMPCLSLDHSNIYLCKLYNSIIDIVQCVCYGRWWASREYETIYGGTESAYNT